MTKVFYVRCPASHEALSTSLCTGLQIVIDDKMTYADAVSYACDLVNREFKRYMVHECLKGLGMKP